MSIILAGMAGMTQAQEAQNGQPEFTAQQVAHGQQIFAAHCAACHGATMVDIFRSYPNAERYYLFISGSMPRHAPGSLAENEYLDIVVYLMDQLGAKPGDIPLPPDRSVLATIVPAQIATGQ